MNYLITPYSLIYLFTSIICLAVATTAWIRWDKPGAKSLFWMMLFISQWTFSGSFEMSAISMDSKLFWSKIEYIGTVAAPVFLLLLTLEYNHLTKYLTVRNIAYLFVIPLIILLLAFTNQWHHWIWKDIYPSPIGMNLAVYKHGIVFWWILIPYCYLMLIASFLLLVWAFLRLPRIYRFQTTSLIAACLIPWAGNFLYITELTPFPGLELTAISMAFTGLICTLAILRFRFLNLVPIARDALVEMLPDGVLVLDNHFTLLDANPSARKILDFDNTDNPAEFSKFMETHPEINSWLLQKQSSAIETTLNSGSYEWTLKPFSDINGKVYGYLLLLKDITPQVKNRNILQFRESFSHLLLKISADLTLTPLSKMDEALNVSLCQLGQFSGTGHCCLLLFNPSLEFISQRHQWDAHTNLPPAGTSLPVPDFSQLTEVLSKNKHIYYQKEQSDGSLSASLLLGLLNSEITPLETAVIFPLMDSGHLKGVLCLANYFEKKDWSAEELSLMKEAARLLSQILADKYRQQEQLEMERQMLQLQKLESLGVLAGGIAHDFNNRFTAILGNIDIAREILPEDSEAQEYLEESAKVIHASAEKTRHILAYSGKGWYSFEPTCLNQIINDSIPLFQSAVGRHITFNYKLSPDIPMIYADADQIRQMLLNLLTNASEAIGKNHGEIDIITRFIDKQILLEIKDTGSGMDEETQKRLFEPFFTTKFIGRGLGMSAVLGIVRAHHGIIKVDSKQEEGTTIKIYLPPSQESNK